MSGFGVKSRVAIGSRTAIGVVVAVGIAFLAVDLGRWKYFRLDLSLSGRNTLDETVIDIIDQLPEKVIVDVFFRPLRPPYDGISGEVFARTEEVLRVAQQSRRNKLELRFHDPNDIDGARQRQLELAVEGVNLIVFSNESGTRKSVQMVFGDIAVVDWGNPTVALYELLSRQGILNTVNPNTWRPNEYIPARVSSNRAEEVLAQSLLKVSSASAPRIYFSTGQGEPSIEGSLSEDMSRLRATLEGDGFEVETWNPDRTPEIPDDCDVLALVGPTQPFPEGTIERVREFVRVGGRLVGAPALVELEQGIEGGVAALLKGYGMVVEPGVVCEPLMGLGGQQIWDSPQCSSFDVGESGLSASHPATEPLRRRGRRLRFAHAAAFRRGGLGTGGQLLDIVTSSPDAWQDLPTRGHYDYAFDRRSEKRRRQRLVMVAQLSPVGAGGEGPVESGRVLGIGSSTFLSDDLINVNRDFLLNAFNWMTEREHRVRVSPLPVAISRIDLERGSALPKLGWMLYVVLPGLCISVGGILAWRRRN